MGWQFWVKLLQQYGLHDLAAELIDAAAPVQFLLAQGLTLGRPMLEPFTTVERLDELIQIFEDPQASRAFTARLREELPS